MMMMGLLRNRSAKSWFIYGFLASLLLVCITTVGVILLIYQYSHHIDQRDYHADAALVLGAAVWGQKPSPIFRERINHAIQLYRAKKVRMLIFTGGTPQHHYPAEADVGRDYAVRHGVPPRDILTENRSRTTYQNLKNAAKEGRVIGLKTYLIVSDHYHMCRAMTIAKDLGIKAFPSPTPTSRYQTRWLRIRFLMQESYHYIAYWLVKTGRILLRGLW